MVNDRGKLVVPVTTRRYQAQAADPRRSIWVGANAGSGKTFVLTQRVLRLLLTGVNPQSILCLTYTKAAAAEMRSRVAEKLAEWAVMPRADLLKTLRDNMDYLIVGRFLGLKELGVYYFAFNAGLGISLSIIQSIIVALYPHLCAVRSDFAKLKESYYKSLRTIGKIMVPFVLIQSVFAPFYVPVLFGKEWVVAVPVLILICLSAIPRPFDAAAFQLLASVDKPQIGLLWNVAFTLLFTVALMIGVYWQAIGVAAAVLIIHVIFVPIFLIWTNRYVFGPRSPFAT